MAGCIGGDGDDGTGGDGDGTGGDGDGTGGDGDGGDTPDPSELPAVHFLTDYNNEAWQAMWEDDLIPAFQDETDIQIDIEYSGFSGEQEDRLATLIQSGEPPAINTSTMDQVADIWANDQLSNVRGTVDQIESVAGEMMHEPFTQEDRIWQVSHGYYTSVFHYRQDIYDQLGLDVPETFQQLLDNARAISESEFDARGYGLAGKKTGKAQDEFQVFLANMGVSPIGLRWKDPDAREEVEIWWPEEEITTLLEFFKELSQYSPDPTGIGWAESLGNWVGGQFAQQYNLNMWPAGVAAGNDVAPIAENTRVAPLPRWEEGGVTKDDVWLSNPTADGHHVFSDAENTPGAKRFLEWLYGGDMERTAGMYSTEPTRFLPNYADVLESDPFQNFDFWNDWPGILERLTKVQNEIVADYYGNVDEADFSTSPVALYVTRFFFPAEMVNMVVTDSATPKEAYEFGKEELEKRYEEGQEKFK